MQDITRKQIENMSDEVLQTLLETCIKTVEHRKRQKSQNERYQECCDLYNDTWIKLKHDNDRLDNFEKRYLLVHIDKVEDVYCPDSDCICVVAKYVEQYQIDTIDEYDVDISYIKVKTNNVSEFDNTIVFSVNRVFEFVRSERVKKIIESVIYKLKQNLL